MLVLLTSIRVDRIIFLFILFIYLFIFTLLRSIDTQSMERGLYIFRILNGVSVCVMLLLLLLWETMKRYPVEKFGVILLFIYLFLYIIYPLLPL